MDQEYQVGTRRFCAYHEGELVGFVFFDPLYKDGRIISYVPNISRFSNKFKYGIFYPHVSCHGGLQEGRGAVPAPGPVPDIR